MIFKRLFVIICVPIVGIVIAVGGNASRVASHLQAGTVSLQRIRETASLANDPGLPALVATVNGQPVSAHELSQAESFAQLSTGGAIGSPLLRNTALNTVIQQYVILQAARADGFWPSQQDVAQYAQTMGVSDPTAGDLAVYSAMLAQRALKNSVVQTYSSPSAQDRAWVSYVNGLIAKAKIVKYVSW